MKSLLVHIILISTTSNNYASSVNFYAYLIDIQKINLNHLSILSLMHTSWLSLLTNEAIVSKWPRTTYLIKYQKPLHACMHSESHTIQSWIEPACILN